jgi:hypothetical protein
VLRGQRDRNPFKVHVTRQELRSNHLEWENCLNPRHVLYGFCLTAGMMDDILGGIPELISEAVEIR